MSNNLSPIAMFVYNRPEHTLKTLTSLSNNPLAKDSVLYIFSDGSKSDETNDTVNEVRKIIREKQWCKEVKIIESPVNKGLANSLIHGITEVVNQHGKVIVLEDDLEFSPYFLQYMNDGLNYYENTPEVMSISAYLPPVRTKLPETFFLHIPTWWGWGTWKRVWDQFNPFASELLEKVNKLNVSRFDFHRTFHYYRLLKRNSLGKVDSWAIRWYASVYTNHGLCLHPRQSLVKNIGFDNTGVHTYNTNVWDTTLADNIVVRNIPLEFSDKAYRAVSLFYFKVRFTDLPHFILKLLKGEYNIKSKHLNLTGFENL